MTDQGQEDDRGGPALEAVLRAQESHRRAGSDRVNQGRPGTTDRVHYTGFICGSAWLAAMLMPLRFGDGLTALYAGRMTLIIGAVALPMLLVEDKALWDSRRSRVMNAFGTDTAWLLAGILYLLAVLALFWMMDIFW